MPRPKKKPDYKQIPQKSEIEGSKTLPDPLFKSVTREEARETGVRLKESENQFSTRADLVIEIPEGVNTAGTLFDFCTPITILEFKSENDDLTEREFVVNQVRTAILYLQAGDDKTPGDYSRYLNAYVVSQFPAKFVDNAPSNGISFEVDKERPWLRWATAAYQKVALIVCRDLPLERRYYRWLLFAPAGSKKWQDFIRQMETEEDTADLLAAAKKLRPKEYAMAHLTIDELFEEARREGELTPEMEAQLAQETAEAVEILLSDLPHKSPTQIRLFFDDMNDAQLTRMLEGVSIKQLGGFAGNLSSVQLKRALGFVKPGLKRQMLEAVLAEQGENEHEPQ